MMDREKGLLIDNQSGEIGKMNSKYLFMLTVKKILCSYFNNYGSKKIDLERKDLSKPC